MDGRTKEDVVRKYCFDVSRRGRCREEQRRQASDGGIEEEEEHSAPNFMHGRRRLAWTVSSTNTRREWGERTERCACVPSFVPMYILVSDHRAGDCLGWTGQTMVRRRPDEWTRLSGGY
ncbi:hypothetical protein Hypma_008341 [Hypsizygus marmoreus]|uniref:Uncharacterized protein n=1 Tax=Hypsizygus marmoreus TaxID=39966 RepID=A0A369JY42_HYPMA|nr:hypothetical protein Hypma_008341 [Hypsizygus marmoreus]